MHPRTSTEPRQRRLAKRRASGGVLVGIFIGLMLGLALAAGVAYYFMKAPNPYQAPVAAPTKEAAREPANAGKAEPTASEKPRFDFYRILPGAEEPKPQAKAPEKTSPDRATVERATPETAGKAGDKFWLQAGSFAGDAEAENLKAQLALSGWEAVVQSATLPDKGLRYRVRLGPFDNADELNRTKAELARRGFDVAVIKY